MALCVRIVFDRSEGSLEGFAAHDPKAEEVQGHLHPEIEMSQLSKKGYIGVLNGYTHFVYRKVLLDFQSR